MNNKNIPNPQFVNGDIVKCIDSTGWADHFTDGLLYEVKEYIRFVPQRGWLIMFYEDDNYRPYTAFENRFIKEI